MKHEEYSLTINDVKLLSAIEKCKRYGLDIARTISGSGKVEFSIGSLYSSLARLERHGFASSESASPPSSGNTRKYYAITESGRRALNDARDSLRKLWETRKKK